MSRPHLSFVIMLAVACVLLSVSPTFASGPSVDQPYPPMPPGQHTGNVTGKVLSGNTSEGLAGVYVAIVNSNNVSIVYATITSDSTGNYTFTGVNSSGGQSSYCIFASKSEFGDFRSNAFAVEPNDTIFVPAIIIDPRTQATTAPVPSPTSRPTATPTPTPSPTVTISPAPTLVAGYPTNSPPADTPRPTVAIATPVPAASQPSVTTTPGFGIALVIAGFAGAIAYKKLN